MIFNKKENSYTMYFYLYYKDYIYFSELFHSPSNKILILRDFPGPGRHQANFPKSIPNPKPCELNEHMNISRYLLTIIIIFIN